MENILAQQDIAQKRIVNILFYGHVGCGQEMIEEQLRCEREQRTTAGHDQILFETETKQIISQGQVSFTHDIERRDYDDSTAADVVIFVIIAIPQAFKYDCEHGLFEKHVMLIKTVGIPYVVVLINKMDNPNVNWNQAIYEDIKDKFSYVLKKCGFKPGEDTVFMPCSGMSGPFIKENREEQLVPWYTGPTFIEYLDSLPSFNRRSVIEIVTNVFVMGKIESGCCRVGDKCIIMPNRTQVEVKNIYYKRIETDSCVCGETVRLKLKNVEEEEISPGFMICDAEQEPCGVGRVFDAQIMLTDYYPIICSGFCALLYINGAIFDVQLQKLILIRDQNTNKIIQERPRFIKQGQVAIARFELTQSGQTICMEPFKRFPQLAHFMLRDCCDRVVVFGKVLKIIE
ncbi:unnamed protein product [Rotaria magnacalcarata]|uniref:Uncharacterized protein n=3 Tax=Rotaria magnacalcarata TaxID=392030 RepID=A0A820H664_9BILA|nr:unnamed protein product [Rotaria magnacalcarata]